jgi:pimeloyl-ACP methyl ester carboxylesterase
MSAKAPLFLLPGLLCDDALWQHQSAHLQDLAEISVADFTTQTSLDAMARSVLDAAPARFSLAGLSMGGYVALEIMRLAGGRVERLALLDTAARDHDPGRNEQRRAMMAQAGRGRFKGITRRYLEAFVQPGRLEDEALTTAVMDMAKRVGVDAYLRQQQAIIERQDADDMLAAIACPTLVICGRQDGLTPLAASREIADGIAGARLVVIENCGHLTTMERPQAVTALLSYWLQT